MEDSCRDRLAVGIHRNVPGHRIADTWIIFKPEIRVWLATTSNHPPATTDPVDVLAVARIAGIMAAKQTAALIPLCHPLPLSGVTLDLALEAGQIRATASVRTTHQTGVEMEALTAVSVALLTVYDMAKALDRTMTIGGVRLLAKSGGRSGDFRADAPA